MLFEVGRIYTRHQIHVALGGELQTYLPQHNGKIVCGCFQPDLDPEAPHEILVGDTPKVRQKAEMLCQQGGAIPIFLKVHRNRWEYRGLFRVKRLSLDPLEVRYKAQQLGRSYIAAVLYLECASSELNAPVEGTYSVGKNMVQALPSRQTITQWLDICPLSVITPNTGVCALVEEQQVAIFRVGSGETVFAISNYDPFSKTFVLSRGLVGDRNGIPKVASPIYKQNFNLLTGQCFDDETVSISTFEVRVVDGRVQVGISKI